jgi:hypothetical protein
LVLNAVVQQVHPGGAGMGKSQAQESAQQDLSKRKK